MSNESLRDLKAQRAEAAKKFSPRDRVVDNEGDTGTVLRIEANGRIVVDGDSGTTEWSYWPHEIDFEG